MEQGIFAVCNDEAMQGQTVMCRGKACFFLLLVIFTGRLMQERCGAGAFRSVQG